jgi:hypothetical protein
MISDVLKRIEEESLEKLKSWFSTEKQEIIKQIKQRFIHILWNQFLYYENSSIRVKTTCVISKYWYWNEFWNNKTPTWLHLVNEMIGDWLDKIQRFVARNPSIITTLPEFWEEKPWMYWRILTLDWVEENNSNTLNRNVYIHWNIHDWYWKTWDLERSKWCIWLKLDEMVMIFNMLKYYKEKILVYIEEKK